MLGDEMMDNEIKQRFLNESIRIGDELIRLAKRNKNGYFWKTMQFDGVGNLSWHATDFIYSGASGIVLFFLELYRQTKIESYLEPAIEGMRGVEYHLKSYPRNNYGFYTGRMGISYTFLKLLEATGNIKYRQLALLTAQNSDEFYKLPNLNADLISGVSGMLLGLLNLYAATRETWILPKIKTAVDYIVSTAHTGPEGLYWDRNGDTVRGLCGFAHGAAGIGFVFLELGHYFQNDAFFWLAGQAFSYENHFYDHACLNWPDFRNGIYNEDNYKIHEKAFLEGDLKFFTKHEEMNAWCHGAAGIGLSRLMAFELLRKPTYRIEAENAIKKTTITDIKASRPIGFKSFTLCHGAGGKAELFLEAYRIFGDEKYLSLAETIGRKSLTVRQDMGMYLPGYSVTNMPDLSLFMGNAGIGYFFLRLVDPKNITSILAPRIDFSIDKHMVDSDNGIIDYSVPVMRRSMIEKDFKRTLFIINKISPYKMRNFLKRRNNRLGIRERDKFIEFVNGIIIGFERDVQSHINDVYALEMEIIKLDESNPSFALLKIDEIIRTKNVTRTAKNNNQIEKLKLILNPFVKIKTTDWDWNPKSSEKWLENLQLENGIYPELLRITIDGILEEKLTPFCNIVLSNFLVIKNIEEVIQTTLLNFGPVSNKQKKRIRDMVLQQVNQGLTSGILVSEDDPICIYATQNQ